MVLPEGKTFLRNIQNRAGVKAMGNNPVNLRPYPADNPSKLLYQLYMMMRTG